MQPTRSDIPTIRSSLSPDGGMSRKLSGALKRVGKVRAPGVRERLLSGATLMSAPGALQPLQPYPQPPHQLG